MKLNRDDLLGCFSIAARLSQGKLYSFIINKPKGEKISLKEVIPFFYKRNSLFDIKSDTFRKIINLYFKDIPTQVRVMKFVDYHKQDSAVLSALLGELIKAQQIKEKNPAGFNNSELITAIFNTAPSLLRILTNKYNIDIRIAFDGFKQSKKADNLNSRTDCLVYLFKNSDQDIIKCFLNSFSSLDDETFILYAQQLLNIDRLPSDEEFKEDITDLLHFTIDLIPSTFGSCPMLFKFILVKGVDVNKQWGIYSNAYHHLCSVKGTKISHAVWLIDAGAHCSDVVNFQGQTILHSVARSRGKNQEKLEWFKFFINAGIKSHLRDYKNRTALDVIQFNSIVPSDEIIEILKKQIEFDCKQEEENPVLPTYDEVGKTNVTPAPLVAQSLGNFGIHRSVDLESECELVSAESYHNEL